MSEEKNDRSIGALWRRTSKNGNNFSTGFITVNGKKIDIVVFTTKEKKSENSPDAQILLSLPPPGKQAEAPKPVAKPVAKPAAKAPVAVGDDLL